MNAKLVSIILPVYNCEDSLTSIIEQILKNPYQHIQLLIGDDGSVDKSASILSAYTHNPQIKIIFSKENIGPGAMRNMLIAESTGDYIAIQDADDSFLPERFTEQVNFLNDNLDIDVVGTGVSFQFKKVKWGSLLPKFVPSFADWLLQRSMVHASIMFRREVVERAKYHEQIRIGEDYYFMTQLYLNGFKFRNIQKELYVYEIEKDELNSRGYSKIAQLIKAKLEISKLFKGSIGLLFLFLNFSKLIVNYLKSYLLIKLKNEKN